jgi:hypothetical protein
VLAAGGTTATDTFGGSWIVDGGILQVGDVNGNSINGLGFKNGDARQANAVTVNNGVLAIGCERRGPQHARRGCAPTSRYPAVRWRRSTR